MRESGILMPVSSLPGPYGIGCFGAEALKFVDFLAAAGQHIWQLLPLSPTGYGDSPYQSCSAFAGNPYFIDLDALKADGLLTAAQLKAEKWGMTRFRWTTALSTPAAIRCCAPPTPHGAGSTPASTAAPTTTPTTTTLSPLPTTAG